VLCSTCGTANEAGRKFCKECAAALAVICPSCGASNAPDAKFCGQCAAPLAGAPSPLAVTAASPPVATAPHAVGAPPVAERRLVSVIFADLVGFTPFAEGRDSEEVRDVLSRYFDVASEIVERYGGTIEKFIGDAVMAVWGTPVAREDDAERAVRAGLDLVEAVPALGAGIRARAGVLTGEAAVTLGATNQGMVAGDIVNTAARLQSVAEPGTVLVGESTVQAAARAIAFEPMGEAALKGKASPVAAFRAVRVVAERGGRNRSESLEAPFVGRDEELRLLKDGFHATGREARPRLVSITGPAGIGKSRLSWEFLKYVDGLVEPVWYHAGRSPAYGQGISFWALGEMIRSRAGLAETDDEATTRARIAEMVATHVPDEAERRWIEPAMLALLGIGEGAERPEELFAAWRTFFERMAVTGTVVLLFEDLHWADVGLLDFIDHVLEWTRDLPLYIVTLARPELVDRRPNWGAGKRHFSAVFLEPLSEESMLALLAGLVPGLPDRPLRAIVARADGVPLYAVETVRMLVGDGRLTESNGVYVPTGDLSELAVPETLTAVISARLDTLDPADRALLLDASVLGQSFTIDGLSAVSGVDAADLELRLRGLVRRELLVLRADPRSPDRGQYAFVQSLIREVAYNMLARRDRKSRHLAAARFFESLETDELAGALAGHYLAAHENAGEGAEADALAGQARIALKAAADRASSLGAHDQAFHFLTQAFEITTNAAEQAVLAERAGEAAAAAGRHDDALARLEQALALFTAAGDRRSVVRVTAAIGRTMLDVYRSEPAIALLERASVEFHDLAGEPEFIVLDSQLARAYFFGDQPVRAVEVADRVLDAAEHANLVPVIADTMITKGTSLGILGRNREGLLLVKGGGEMAEANDLPRIALRSYINRTFAEGLTDPRASFESTRVGLALARRLGLRSIATVLLGNATLGAFRVGEWDWAEGQLAEALADELDAPHRLLLLGALHAFTASRGGSAKEVRAEMAEQTQIAGDVQSQMQMMDAAAWGLFVAGRYAEAHDQWIASGAVMSGADREMLPFAGRSALWHRDPRTVRADVTRLDATGSYGRAIEAARTGLLAGAAALEGQAAEAMAGYRVALRAWRELQLPWDEAITGLEMAMFLDRRDPEVKQAIDASRRIFTELGAAPFLARLEEALEERGLAAAATPPSSAGAARARSEVAAAD
jgi:class 3 adenylate cyclase/tetratricopeptide (TPR) repeat protein